MVLKLTGYARIDTKVISMNLVALCKIPSNRVQKKKSNARVTAKVRPADDENIEKSCTIVF